MIVGQWISNGAMALTWTAFAVVLITTLRDQENERA